MEDQQMDAHRLDAVARCVARSPLSRRMTIRTGGLGLLGLATGAFRQRSETSAEASAAPLTIQSTPGATPAAETLMPC
jgi:hypothetical protein